MGSIESESVAPIDALGRIVTLGRVSGVFGVQGWIKVFSHTSPRDGILDYSPWYLVQANNWLERRLLDGRIHGKGIVARVEGCDDRNQAARLIGRNIAVRRDQLPALGRDDFYWSDLEGLRVRNLNGVDLGVVSHLFDTGANAVMVVKNGRERLIPFVWEQVVKRVELEAGDIQVDWDPEF